MYSSREKKLQYFLSKVIIRNKGALTELNVLNIVVLFNVWFDINGRKLLYNVCWGKEEE